MSDQDLKGKLCRLLQQQFPLVPERLIYNCVYEADLDPDACFQRIGEENARMHYLQNGYAATVPSPRQRSISVPSSDVITNHNDLQHSPGPANAMYYQRSGPPNVSSAHTTASGPVFGFGSGTFVLRNSGMHNQTNGPVSVSSNSGPSFRPVPQHTASPNYISHINSGKPGIRLIVQRKSQFEEKRMDPPSTSGYQSSSPGPGIQVTPAPGDQYRIQRPGNLCVEKLSTAADSERNRSRSVASSPVTAFGPPCSPSVWLQKRPDLVADFGSHEFSRHASSPSSPISNRNVSLHGSVPSLSSSYVDDPSSSAYHMSMRPVRTGPLTNSFSVSCMSNAARQQQQQWQPAQRVEIFPGNSGNSGGPSIRIGVNSNASCGRSSPTLGLIHRKHGSVSPLSLVINSPTAQIPPASVDQRRTSYPVIQQYMGNSGISQTPSCSSKEPATRSSSISGMPGSSAFSQPLYIHTEPDALDVCFSPQQKTFGTVAPTTSGGIQISFGAPGPSPGLSVSFGGTNNAGHMRTPIRLVGSGANATINFGPQAEVQLPSTSFAGLSYPHQIEQPLAPSEEYIKTLIGHQLIQKKKMHDTLSASRTRIEELRSDVNVMELNLLQQRKHSRNSLPKEEATASLHAETRKLQAELEAALEELNMLRDKQDQHRRRQQQQHAAEPASISNSLNAAPISARQKPSSKNVFSRFGRRLVPGRRTSKGEDIASKFYVAASSFQNEAGSTFAASTEGGGQQQYAVVSSELELFSAASTAEPGTSGNVVKVDELGPDSDQWDCNACTFRNAPIMPFCEVCDMPRVLKEVDGWVFVPDPAVADTLFSDVVAAAAAVGST